MSAAFCRNGSCKRLLALQLRNQRKAINPPSPGCKNQKCVKKCVIDAENRLDSNESKRFFFMPVVGVEPTRYHYQWILSPHRLPFRHTGTSVDVQQHYYSGFLHQNQAVFFLFSRASYGSGRIPPCAGLFTSRFAAGLFRNYPLFPARVCAVFCPAPVLPRYAPGRSIAVSYIPLSPRR